MRNKEDVVRGVAAGVAMASTMPYLTLKMAWLCGSEAGVRDPGAMDKLWLLNLITFGMDVIALALALTFVRPWGPRVRAGLVAFPMWVATGLLGTILVAVPVTLLAGLVLGPEHRNAAQQADDGLAGWVFGLVYGGFSVQGVALILAFVLYARRRWAGLLSERVGDLPGSPTLVVQRAFAGVAALLGLGVAVVRAYWAAGGTAGLPLRWVEERSRSVATMDAVTAVMAVAAAGALLVLVFRIGPGRRLRTPFAVAWTAAGSIFGWGSWQLVAFGSTTTVPDLPHAVPGLMVLVEAGQVVAGLLVLATGAMALTERAAAAAGRPPAAVESRA
ncbi:hypothetical protein PUR71_06245 [Streptomyces sp. SP17BM10]|uniref:hypothetical protein n=1 Tax=Streptomyces sp. SP17BM10 TaxID=3002530 RepID=UPI002E7AA460|nr:hypothetical protein [Streptomyces sp. SP17BM10]MEE1782523.1 hypothetical protein [Streptomyces sp. SP17BM10]